MRVLLIVLFVCIGKLCIAQQENYLQGDPVRKYNVKQVTEYYYSDNDTNSVISVVVHIFHNNREDTVYKIEKDGIRKLYYVDVYNDSGQLTGYEFYSGDGTVNAKSVFVYDDKGHRTEFDSYAYYQGNKMEVKLLYKYGDDGKMIEQDVYSSPGEFSNRILYTYDSRGLKTDETWNDPSNSKLTGKTTFQYDDLGNLTQVITYSAFGEVQSSVDSRYSQPDQYNNWRYMTNTRYIHSMRGNIYQDIYHDTIVKRVIEY